MQYIIPESFRFCVRDHADPHTRPSKTPLVGSRRKKRSLGVKVNS